MRVASRLILALLAPVALAAALPGTAGADKTVRETAYRDVLDAWRNYLRRHNRGRGVVLIGHSQGTFMLTRLAAEQIDPKRRQRKHRSQRAHQPRPQAGQAVHHEAQVASAPAAPSA